MSSSLDGQKAVHSLSVYLVATSDEEVSHILDSLIQLCRTATPMGQSLVYLIRSGNIVQVVHNDITIGVLLRLNWLREMGTAIHLSVSEVPRTKKRYNTYSTGDATGVFSPMTTSLESS